MTSPYLIRQGIPAATRADAAELYWHAFEDKLGPVMRPERRAMRFLQRVIDPDYAFSVTGPDGRLLGVAGFKTVDGAFVAGGLGDLFAIYGPVGGLWRTVVLALIERPVQPGRLLMDGIAVADAARGQGIGAALLDAVTEEARRRELDEVRLDVVDTNARARSLYERQGFKPIGATTLGPLHRVFRFGSSTTMVRPVRHSPVDNLFGV